MARAAVLLAGAAAVRGQHHHDPFAGSGCNCSGFCAGGCSIFPEPARTNVTMYRMTPLNVDTAVNKNTGDDLGDTTYVMSRRTSAYQCAHSTDPSQNWQCALLIVKGDDPYSTDLVIGFTVEIDGKWGPYLYCNPLDVAHPETAWNCSTSISSQMPSHEPANYPAQCKAANFSGESGYCYTNRASSTVSGVDLGGCCTAAINQDAWGYTYYASNQSCAIYTGYHNHAAKCDGGVTGHWEQPHGYGPPPCECPKIHQSVGRRNMTGSGYGGHGVSMGWWYSTTQEGQCAPGHTPGDGTCSWRTVGISKAVNASCLYDRIDTFCEERDPACFARCPAADPGYPWKYNRTTSCYSECYSNALKGITQADVQQPWDLAFASNDASKGGCPGVTPPNLPPKYMH